MDKKINKLTRRGIAFVLLLGTLSHFFYQWSGQNFFVGLFFPNSESTWEHMKLLFLPTLLWLLLYTPRLGDASDCMLPGFLCGMLIGTAAIPVLFYSYTGILGRDFFLLDLLVFVGSVLIAFGIGARLAKGCRLTRQRRLLEVVVYLLLLCFVLFSCYPPRLGIFQIPPSAG